MAGRLLCPPGLRVSGVTWFQMGCYPVFCGFTMKSEALARVQRFMGVFTDSDISPSGGGCCHRLVKNGMMVLIISMADKRFPKNETAAIIAHEATHAMRFIMEKIGEDEPGLEQEAYLVQQIVQDCLYALDAHWRDRDGHKG